VALGSAKALEGNARFPGLPIIRFCSTGFAGLPAVIEQLRLVAC